jgi:hypothetical protein
MSRGNKTKNTTKSKIYKFLFIYTGKEEEKLLFIGKRDFFFDLMMLYDGGMNENETHCIIDLWEFLCENIEIRLQIIFSGIFFWQKYKKERRMEKIEW